MRHIVLFLLKLSFAIVFTLGLGEVSARAYWRFVHHLSIFKPEKILYAYYPDLLHIDHHQPSTDDETFDILMLGGSTLNPNWVQVERHLMEKFAYRGHRHVRCFNLAYSAHTSRDSWLKYKQLQNVQFDAVILYQGVNEVRANNIAPEFFKDDYSHYSWYELVNTFAGYHNQSSFSLGYTLHMILLQAKQMVFKDMYLPTHQPPESHLAHGADVKTAKSYRTNLNAMLSLAEQKNENFFLVSFASHVPEHYSLEKFNNKELDYGLHTMPIEVWGKTEHVIKALKLHNQVILDLKDQHPHAHFIDLNTKLSQQGQYFNDLCHFSLEGSARFSEALYEGLLPLLKP